MVGDSINDFSIHNNLAERDQIRNEFADVLKFVKHLKASLLIESNLLASEFNAQSILINLFMQAVPNFVQHFKRASDNRMGLSLQRVFLRWSMKINFFICVHLRLSAV